MLTRCDKCPEIFEEELQTRREGEIETTFFSCPGCGSEYEVFRALENNSREVAIELS